MSPWDPRTGLTSAILFVGVQLMFFVVPVIFHLAGDSAATTFGSVMLGAFCLTFLNLFGEWQLEWRIGRWIARTYRRLAARKSTLPTARVIES